MRYPRFAGTPARSNALLFPVQPSEINSRAWHPIPRTGITDEAGSGYRGEREWRIVGWKRSESSGVVNEIDESVWNVEKNGRIRFQSSSFIGMETTSRETVRLVLTRSTPRRTLGRSSEDRRLSHCFSGSLPLLHPLYASDDDSLLSYGPSLDPNHEKTHPSSASPSRPSQFPQPFASAPTPQHPLSPPGLHGKLALVL